MAITKNNNSERWSKLMLKEIYLAGGCFWGTEQYLQNVNGIIKTEVGYANGKTEHPTYEQVCHENTGHAETVKAEYNDQLISLPFLLSLYYDVINPTSVNRQGGDRGVQYRTGIYYTEPSDEPIILASITKLQTQYEKPIAIEVLPLENYSRAEEYHQKYLSKNPTGYCHIGTEKFELAKQAKDPAKKPLTPLQIEVTQKNGTEPPFKNEYYNHYDRGIYVDITTGEPLFASTDKFESGCGWPAFSSPIRKELVTEITDKSHGMLRTEVRSATGDAHLGHVFTDGPSELGGLRYCINSAALLFIPQERMEEQGYGAYLSFVK